MSDKTKIEWADRTWNPLRGCSKTSEGCKNCYAIRVAHRFGGPGRVYEGLTQSGPGGPNWTGKVERVPGRLLEPLHWRHHQRVFMNSMSDIFHDGFPDWALDEIFGVVLACYVLDKKPDHTFMCLTKRPRRMQEYFTGTSPINLLDRWARALDGVVIMDNPDVLFSEYVDGFLDKDQFWPLPNLWLGVSVENQQAADERIPLLLQTPSAVRFLSCEPLLGPVDLHAVPRPDNAYFRQRGEAGCITDPNEPDDYIYWHKRDQINWVIVGGESGPGARPMHPDWARSLRDQCTAAGVAFHFKQWGEWAPYNSIDPRPDNAPRGIVMGKETVWRVGKKAAGRLLDGRTWDEFPEVAHGA